jgi:hypothetical protein
MLEMKGLDARSASLANFLTADIKDLALKRKTRVLGARRRQVGRGRS